MEVRDLVKRYPKRPVNAVDGISFGVRTGEVFGLLGPNGAGKTTTMGVLTTRVLPTSGTARVVGVDVVGDPVAARARIAVVPQWNNLDRALNVRENLVYHAAYHRVPAAERARRASDLLSQFGLGDRAGDQVERLSGGQAQRLMIARALIHDPDVLFLDEPTTGLDPQARLFVWDRIRELRASGRTLLLTTHDMDEAAELADRVGIIDHGRLLALDTPQALTRTLPGSSTVELDIGLPAADARGDRLDGAGPGAGPAPADAVDALSADLAALDAVERVEPAGTDPPDDSESPSRVDGSPGGERRVRLRLYLSVDGAGLLGPAATMVAARGGQVRDVRLGRPSLEDVFIQLTGRGLR